MQLFDEGIDYLIRLLKCNYYTKSLLFQLNKLIRELNRMKDRTQLNEFLQIYINTAYFSNVEIVSYQSDFNNSPITL
ncbi:MAG: hypothetical protein AMS26_22825, partial [Bacteroides sp. SM23_62]